MSEEVKAPVKAAKTGTTAKMPPSSLPLLPFPFSFPPLEVPTNNVPIPVAVTVIPPPFPTLVEDNEINKKLFIKQLQSKGLNCDIASNGEEAIMAFLNNKYDII